MINNIAKKGFGDQIINIYELKPEIIINDHPLEKDIWSKIWENPGEYVPKNLPILECDLLLVLGIHPKLGDLIPYIAEKLKAKAVLYPIDDRKMAPEGKKTIEEELESRGIHVEFPEPFCILEKSDNKLVNDFAKKFGRPKFKIDIDSKENKIKKVHVIRDTPCGTTACISKKLAYFSCNDKQDLVKKIHDEHNNQDSENYCLAEMDPHFPLMQEAADLVKDAIFESCGYTSLKEIIIKKLEEVGEIEIDKLKEILASSTEKYFETERTYYLYIDELIKNGRILRQDNKIRLV